MWPVTHRVRRLSCAGAFFPGHMPARSLQAVFLVASVLWAVGVEGVGVGVGGCGDGVVLLLLLMLLVCVQLWVLVRLLCRFSCC